MTDKEIIKALEWHSNDEIHCCACPYEEHSVTHYCVDMVIEDALDLINRQKAEIERLEQEKGRFEADVEMFTDIGKMYSELKAEAVKEFADELIYKIVNTPTKFESTYYMYREGIAFRQNEIIDIIKEMVGEG